MGVQISLPRPIFKYFRILSQVGGMAYTAVLEAAAERHKGSSPLLGIVFITLLLRCIMEIKEYIELFQFIQKFESANLHSEHDILFLGVSEEEVTPEDAIILREKFGCHVEDGVWAIFN